MYDTDKLALDPELPCRRPVDKAVIEQQAITIEDPFDLRYFKE